MVDGEKSEEIGEVVGCSVKNIGILEDMAKVNHIFCDKTGTLTKNQLIFKSLCIDDKRYDLED